MKKQSIPDLLNTEIFTVIIDPRFDTFNSQVLLYLKKVKTNNYHEW